MQRLHLVVDLSTNAVIDLRRGAAHGAMAPPAVRPTTAAPVATEDRCHRHLQTAAKLRCRSCHLPFCADCLRQVLADQDPVCQDCALIDGGIRHRRR